jgi:hypothetical protein
MSDAFSIVLFVGGCSIFLTSLLYAREHFRYREYNRFSERLYERFRAARELPREEQAAEFAAISQAHADFASRSKGPRDAESRDGTGFRRGIL